MGFFDYFFKTTGTNRQEASNFDEEYSSEINNDVEFSSEMYDRVFDVSSIPAYNSYTDNGIRVTEATYPIMKITYDGLLARSGAQEISAVVGYGNNLSWEDVATYTLQKVDYQSFEASIPVKRSGNLNVVFKDSAGNWDNNSGMNYSFTNHFYQGSH